MPRANSWVVAGWSKRPSGKAEASETGQAQVAVKAEGGVLIRLTSASTLTFMNLVVFFNILVGRNVWAR